MIIKLHKQARTTPAIRKEIQQATGTLTELAARYNVTIDTIRKWKSREAVEDRSHTTHRLQTSLTPAQEPIAVELSKILKLGFDDLQVVIHELLNPAVSRSGLERCLRGHGVGSLRDLEPTATVKTTKPFKPYDPDYFHFDVKYLPQMDARRNLPPLSVCRYLPGDTLGVRPDQIE